MIDAAARQALGDLVDRHAWLIDHGQADQVVDLYTSDARLIGIGPDKIGREAIAAWARGRAAMTERRSRHAQTNIVLDEAGSGEVRGTILLTLYRHDGPGEGSPAPMLIGEFDDLYHRGPDGTWRFAERRLTVLFGSA